MLRNTNLKIIQDVKNLELERDNWLKSLSDSHAVCNTLKFENHVLIAKNKSLQNEMDESKKHSGNFSSEMLNKLLHIQKHSSDRFGLRFDKTVHMSSNLAYTPKTMFVKPVIVEEVSSNGHQAAAQTLQGKKGKKILVEPYQSYFDSKVMNPLGNYILKGLSLHVIIVEKLVTFGPIVLI